MAFPATYDFNYYKGDTFEFRIYPKKNDGTVFELSGFKIPSSFANYPDYYEDSSAPYDSAQFTISTVRGNTGLPIKCFARISDDGTFVQCAIRPSDSYELSAGTEYVYDVEVRKPAGSPGTGQYEIVHTLLTGRITITDQVTGAQPTEYSTISNNMISGIAKPVACNMPSTNIIETSEYFGNPISWSPTIVDSKFAAGTVYTATVTLNARDGYRMFGTPSNFFAVENATSTTSVVNSTGASATLTIVFPATNPKISISPINGVTVPVNGATPSTSVTATSEYTASLVWKEKSLSDPATYSEFTGAFKPSRTYQATITLTPKTGYTVCGIASNFFSVTGALSYTNAEGSGIVTAEFAATGA
jgi:hypothetical protein